SGTRRGQDHRVFVDVGRNGALRLLCEATGFEADGASAERTVIENGFGKLDFWTLQGVFSFVLRRMPVWRATRQRSSKGLTSLGNTGAGGGRKWRALASEGRCGMCAERCQHCSGQQ